MTSDLQRAFSQAVRPVPSSTRRRPRKPSTGASVTIRLTNDEKAELQRNAGERTLSNYIRDLLFGAKGKRGPDRRPSFDSAALARLLGILGQSNLVPNVAALADAARIGALEEGPTLLPIIRQMQSDLALIRDELLRALGVKPR